MGAGAVRPQQEFSPASSSNPHCHRHSSNRGTSNSSSTSTSSTRGSPGSTMKCEGCKQNFTLFRRKKICGACGRHFCSRCLPEDKQKPKSAGRHCRKCTILMSGCFTRAEIALWRIKDLRCFLDHNNVATTLCREKCDLVDLLVSHFKKPGPDSESRNSGSIDTNAPAQATPAPTSTSSQQPAAHPARESEDGSEGGEAGESGGSQEEERADLPEEQEPSVGAAAGDRGDAVETEILLNRLAALLIHTDLDMSANPPQDLPTQHASPSRPAPSQSPSNSAPAFESSEDQQSPDREEGQDKGPKRANRMHLDDIDMVDDIEDLSIRQLKEILVNNFVNFKGCCEKWELIDRVKRLWHAKQENKEKDIKNLDLDHPDLCKICMDAVVDCVLLECGHMVTCTQCGKQLTECPICRQCIIRAIRIFRS